MKGNKKSKQKKGEKAKKNSKHPPIKGQIKRKNVFTYSTRNQNCRIVPHLPEECGISFVIICSVY
jgi:hypothetical protein